MADPDSRGRSGVRLNTLPIPRFNYPTKMKLFGISEAKLFHFHWIFKINEIKSAKRLHTYIHINPHFTPPEYDPPFQKAWIRP